MNNIDNQELIEKITAIVKNASAIMMKRDFDVKEKGDVSNLVTSADIAVQKELEAKLTPLVPGSVFLGEEGDIPDTNTEFIWVVDPIDGTANFARNLSLSVISVALLRNFKQYIGVVYNPYLDNMYWAIEGEGAFMNGNPIHVSDRPFRSSVLCSAMSLYDKRYAKPCFNIIEKIYTESDDLRRLGTAALEMCELAAGSVDLYFEIRLCCWDYAAASLILKEAGGYVEVMFHNDIPLNKPAGIIAANTKNNFEHVREIVYEEVTEELF